MQSQTSFRPNRLALLMLAGLGLILALMFLALGPLAAAPSAAQSLSAAIGGTPLAPAANHPLVHPAADGDLDTTFVDPQVGVSGDDVFALAQQPDGKIMIGGTFESVAGQTRYHVARLNSDGTLDTTFGFANITRIVYAMALQPDGKVLVAGGTLWGGSGFVSRLNPDGTFDTSFGSFAGGGTVDLGGLGAVYALGLQPDGKIVIGGPLYLKRLNSNGAFDTSFADPNVNDIVYSLMLQPDGKVLIGGAFTSVGGSTRHGVARLNSDGTLDSSFADPNLASGTANVCKFPETVQKLGACALALQSDGKVVIGGNFTSVGGQTRNLTARLNSDGTLDASFGSPAMTNVSQSVARALALQTDGKVVIGGVLGADVGGGVVSIHVVRLNWDGTVDTAFRADFSDCHCLSSLIIQMDGKVVVGGNMGCTKGGYNIERVARLLNTGAPWLTPTPTPTPTATATSTPTNTPTPTPTATSVPSAQRCAPVDWNGLGVPQPITENTVLGLSLVLDNADTPYVAFENGSGNAMVMKFNGPYWANVGGAGFAMSGPAPSLAFDSANTPYLAFQDPGASSKLTVKKFNGANWVNVGAAGFSAGQPNWLSLALDSANAPYVALADGADYNRVTVMKFDGANWVNVGAASFSGFYPSYLTLALDSANVPYVGFVVNSKVTVMKFDGANWVNVGAAGFSAGGAAYLSLALDSANAPYVAYQDAANGNKATVMKFNGATWVNVGVAGFSAGGVTYTSLALDNANTPYVAFADTTTNAMVMKFDGANWVSVGGTTYDRSEASTASLALDSTGRPYVGFKWRGKPKVMWLGCGYDFADYYSTAHSCIRTAGAGGGMHEIGLGAPYLGQTPPDAESNCLESVNADGDDVTGTDDEDGVTPVDPSPREGFWTYGKVSDGEGGAVQVTISGGSACLGAYLFGPANNCGDGAVTLRNAWGTPVPQPLPSGTQTFYFDFVYPGWDSYAADKTVTAAFRVTSPINGSCTSTPVFTCSSAAPDGEIESYRWAFPPFIAGQVRYDADNDGVLADAESGISGVTVKLYADDGAGKPTGAALATTTTDASGYYTFTNQAAGNYVVVETNLNGYASTNDKDGATSNSFDQIAVTLAAYVSSIGNDFLDSTLANIAGQVRNDADNDGDLADAESGISGVTVKLYAGDGTGKPTGAALATTTTDASGYYTFTNVAPGAYVVVEINLDGYASTNDTDGAASNTLDQIAVALADVNSTGNDFLDTLISTPADISGQVRYDTDGDGDLADAESGINGVTVELYADDGTGKPAGAALRTTATDSSGYYTFTNVAAGNYVVVETNLSGYPTSTNDKDGAASNTRDQIAVALAGVNSTGNDFLDTNVANISGQVRHDADKDGDLADAESGISGVTVELYADDGAGKPTGAALATTTTDATGYYTLTNVVPGSYVIVEINPSGYASTNDKDGAASNSFDQIAVTLAGADSAGNDFLDTNLANISGQVRYDADGDGDLTDVEAGISGVTISLYAGDGAGNPTGSPLANTTTDASGYYTFTYQVSGSYVIFELDLDGYISTNDKDDGPFTSQIAVALAGVDSTGNDFLDTGMWMISGYVLNDTNGNGAADEYPPVVISGVTVKLYANDGTGKPTGAALATTTTDGNGYYFFLHLPPGNYVVVEVNPSGYISTYDQDGVTNNTLDQIAVVLINANSTGNRFLDTQVTTPADISGQVRNDADNDGVLADAESGISGVTVELYADDGTGKPTGAALATTTTDATGYYTFTNQAAGSYVIVETNLGGYTSTNDKDGATSNTRDQIAIVLAGVNSTGNDFLDTNLASISGQVRNDTDSDGDLADAESGISGVTIELYADDGTGKPTGVALATTTTDASGYYTFTNVAAGAYVVVETNLSGYISTNDKDGAANNTLDQIAVALAGVNSTGNDFLDSALDFGDLPAPYKTLLADDGPRHSIVPGAPYLGTVAPDIEPDGQPNATATGDDVNGADDEDGVVRTSGKGRTDGGWSNGTVASGQGGAVNVTISAASACLGSFFDFNSSGNLSAVTLRDASGAAVSQPIAAGAYTFYFDVPAGTFAGSGGNPTIYSLFRVTSPISGSCAGSAANSATGAAADGEVEGYAWGFTPNAVTVTSFRATAAPFDPAAWFVDLLRRLGGSR